MICKHCGLPAGGRRKNKHYLHPRCRFAARVAQGCAKALRERKGQ